MNSATDFPHATSAGVDGTLNAAYAFLPWLEARADANYTRIFSSAKPERGDAYIAGGALDEYFIFRGGIAALCSEWWTDDPSILSFDAPLLDGPGR